MCEDGLKRAVPLDASYLFVEELWMMSRALRETVPDEVADEDLEENMPAVD